MKRSLNLWLLGCALVCALSWFFGRALSTRDKAVRPPAPVAETPAVAESEPAPAIQVRLLNGTDESGLAREYSLLLPRAGCIPAGIGNAPGGLWDESLLVNRRLPPAQAAGLAKRLGDLPLIGEWDDRVSEDVVLVLGADHGRIRTAVAELLPAGHATDGK